MLELKKYLSEKIYERLKDKYPLSPEEITLTYPPDHRLGDFALTFPFELSKKIKTSPRQVAGEAISYLARLQGVEKVEIAGPGYINLFLEKESFFHRQLASLEKKSLFPEEEKIIIEHTNINPNKAAHIGHLRNACLGDTLARCLKYRGENVEIQNYIDDTGVQVVDVVFGFMELEKKNLEQIKKIKGRFDYYCWDLYSRVSAYLEEHPEAQEKRAKILKKIEKGEGEEAEIARHISRRILRAHIKTMKRIDVSYDLLPCESSILELKFWQKAFALLKEKKAITRAKKGLNKDCWVMELEAEPEREKVIVRSDGTVTYVGKDIAYQLWKFGLLGEDFFYQPFLHQNEKTMWITTSEPSRKTPRFGKASKVYNVIDTRQAYLQKIVVQGLRSLGFEAQAEKSIHFSYEMVALSLKSLEELDFKLSEEERQKTFLEVSGRKGLGVKADDLLDRLEEKALAEVEKRNPELLPQEKKKIAHQIAVGALRYFMLKFARNSLIVFDFDEALNFEGETGPYLQYSYVRINSIFRKMREREGFKTKDLEKMLSSPQLSLKSLTEKELEDFWELIFYASQLEEEILHSILSLEFSHLAKFSFNLCQKFNSYYHLYSILGAEGNELKRIRVLTIYYIKEILKKVLYLIGIPTPEKM
ncbi:MAG: arginine--tRNA ligase [Candidatus Aminicenantales bacterium]